MYEDFKPVKPTVSQICFLREMMGKGITITKVSWDSTTGYMECRILGIDHSVDKAGTVFRSETRRMGNWRDYAQTY